MPIGGGLSSTCGAPKSRLRSVWRQLACLGAALAVLCPTWTAQTTVTEMTFGLAWVSFILAIFVVRPEKKHSTAAVLARVPLRPL